MKKLIVSLIFFFVPQISFCISSNSLLDEFYLYGKDSSRPIKQMGGAGPRPSPSNPGGGTRPSGGSDSSGGSGSVRR